jgi:glutathione-specific gamma-glutamylcyclotransferase
MDYQPPARRRHARAITATGPSGGRALQERDLWVFAYGSLIWRPGFDFAERRQARLRGYRRRFCMTSIHYRGTPDRPGLVLALDACGDGECAGVAYRVEAPRAASVLAYLRERELVSYAYVERHLPVELDDGRRVEALAYVTNPAHPQYCGHLSPEEQADVIVAASGPMGPNREYLLQTEASLAALGLDDPDLSSLAALVRARIDASLA